LLVPTAAANSGHSEYPEEIQEVDCPDYSDVAFSDEVNSSDYMSCVERDMTNAVLRTNWDATQNIHGIGNWLAGTGRGLQNNSLPVLPSIGEGLESQGERMMDGAHNAQSEILTY